MLNKVQIPGMGAWKYTEISLIVIANAWNILLDILSSMQFWIIN